MHDSYEELISLLISAMGQRTLFYRDHPRVLSVTSEFVRGLNARIRADAKHVFFLGVVDERLVHDGRFLFGSTVLGRKLLQFAERLRCGGFLFREELTDDDVLALLDLFAGLHGNLANLDEARGLLRAHTQAIQLSPAYEDPGWFGQFVYSRSESWGEAPGGASSEAMTRVYQSLFDTVEDAHGRAAGDSELDVNGARGVAERMLKSSGGRLHDILRVVRYPNYDTYTVGHSVRVSMLAVQLGLTLGLPEHFLIELGTAGLLHDVGKAKIPHEILFKPARLDADERRIIAHHPRLGAALLLEQKDASPLSIGAAFGHHIHHDRSGYPQIAAGHAVSHATALIQACDVFEALTAIRPYKAPLSPRRAFEIMFTDPGEFHPGALAALVRSLGLYPPGSRVLLSSGERALVVAAGNDVERPALAITHAPTGAPLPHDASVARDLAQIDPRELSIVRLLEDAPAPDAAQQATRPAC